MKDMMVVGISEVKIMVVSFSAWFYLFDYLENTY